MPYKLSATLTQHSSDVRAVASPTNDLVLSASRDTTAIVWNRTSSGFTPEHTLAAGSRYVNAVSYAVTGGQDTVINVFNLANPKADPDFSLVGHTENVCALDASAAGTIISGSWDKTAKVWKDWKLVHELKGHEYSVWAVLIVDEDQYLTASADKTIRLWQQHKSIQTFKGHTDAVRGLAIVPDIGFASCSNDSEVRVYSLSGHTSFVYSLSVLPDGNIVSSGEDRTVRVWEGGECTQTIVHPAISVWAVSSMPNGDIVTGTSDGVVRVFSASEERWASAEDLKEYEDKVASQALPAQQIGDVKKSDLPGPEALSAPGNFQWDSASNSWQKIGDVVDAVGQGRKQLYEGKEYDYVFDVDIQDGVPPLKLPYNRTLMALLNASSRRTELDLTYIDQVVKFIETNTAGVAIGTGNEEYRDPFTGASRYRSNANTGQNTAPSEAQPAAQAPSANTNYSDPYTGASRYTGTPAPPAAAPSQKILPVSKSVTFKQANVTAMQAKIQQFDDVLRQEITTSNLAMRSGEIFTHLQPLTASPPGPSSTTLSASHVEQIISVLEKWPASQRFPVIDLGRLLFGYSPSVFRDSNEWTSPWSSPLPKARETNMLLLFRTLSNAFQEGTELNSSLAGQSDIGEAPYPLFSKNLRVALVTVLFNISCLGVSSPLDAGVVGAESNDSEAAYRALVAVGNIASAAKQSGAALGGDATGQLMPSPTLRLVHVL
ncbi:phospholipase A-2-activating protein [Ephemerocybe angulata]|uniref:Phospholipase A-2-activating protein n=1 Tax=Ephemerocybe angulata TaxID=980116 RepID=A0A8H6IGT2_9AGAR|nr:phospholipase A-2-activating protein [Tulosesus angulatus]